HVCATRVLHCACVSIAHPMPAPSLSRHPSQGVSLGDTVTLHCHLPQSAAWVWLYKKGRRTYSNYKNKVQDTAEFSFMSTNREHAGIYWCQYQVPWSSEESKSDPVELVLTGEGTGDSRWLCLLPTGPCPTECVETGTNVTIQCWNKKYGAAFLLHKDGCSAPTQRQDPDVVGTATFTMIGVTPADSGTYRCSYRPKGYPFLSSPLGSNVTLEVTPTPAHPGGSQPHLNTPGVVVEDVITQTPGPHRCCRQFPWEPGGGSGWGLHCCLCLHPRPCHLLPP
uniref:Ig-like domain-containing protein n=1 Tax=Phasianus colchicus TaxID=9054 RepID=A0A669QNZ3_PHACC